MEAGTYQFNEKSLEKLTKLKELALAKNSASQQSNKFRDFFSKVLTSNSEITNISDCQDDNNTFIPAEESKTDEKSIVETEQLIKTILNEQELYNLYVEYKQQNNLKEYLTIYLNYIRDKETSRILDDILRNLYNDDKLLFISEFLEKLLKTSVKCDNFFYNFIENLDHTDYYQLFNVIASFNSNCLAKHFRTVTYLYKTMSEEQNIYEKLVQILSKYSSECSEDRNYGKLLLTALQNRELSLPYVKIFEDIVNINKGVLKRPCLNALEKLRT